MAKRVVMLDLDDEPDYRDLLPDADVIEVYRDPDEYKAAREDKDAHTGNAIAA